MPAAGCVCWDSPGLIKPLPPAQQGLLCSQPFNDSGGWPAASTSGRIKEKRNSLASMKKYEVQSHLLVSKLIETTEAVNLLATKYTSFAAL